MGSDLNLVSNYPFFRFATYFLMERKVAVYGPRICYVPSLYLIVQGKGKLRIEETTYDLFPGVQIYLEAGKTHVWQYEPDDTLHIKTIFFEWNCRPNPKLITRSDFFCDPGKPVVREYIHPRIHIGIQEYLVLDKRELWLRFHDQLITRHEVSNSSHFPESLKVQGNFHLFLDYFLGISVLPTRYIDPRIKRILQQMELYSLAEQEQDIKLAEWIAHLGLSRSYFFALFKEYTGFTPHSFLNQSRVNKAKDDLIQSNLSISGIAEKYHYSSVHNFSKSFKKVAGKSPSQYRAAHRML
jgi:AraC-like DNA-binding protein